MALLMGATSALFAAARLKSLDVAVQLLDNGAARITETRQMTVEDSGTECYITIGNLNGSRISDFSVTDETGLVYQTVTPWNTSASRQAKAGHAGIVNKSDGYELCWGLGQSGERTYVATYTVSDLVRSYDDYDGFNYMFVAERLDPPAERATVRISRQGGFTADDVRMWAFRFSGDIELRDGVVCAETTDELSSSQAMIVMLQFEKGLFHPSKQMAGSFEAVKERAFKGSDYLTSITDWLVEIGSYLYGLVVVLFIPIIYLWDFVRRWRARRKAFKDLGWFRDLPYNGNLLMANQVLNAYRYGKNDYKSLISAFVLRLISIGALRIEQDGIGIGELKRERGLTNTKALRDLHGIFRDAAGDDGVLQPKELKRWMKKNNDRVSAFVSGIVVDRSVKSYKKEVEKVREVFGLRQFLKDFTLANERHASEVALWKDYLIYAELFGIADQVRRDMQRLNPDYFKMDEQFGQMVSRQQLPALLNITLSGINLNISRLLRERRRATGGGGSASSSGGGGYSGGGSGGGIR